MVPTIGRLVDLNKLHSILTRISNISRKEPQYHHATSKLESCGKNKKKRETRAPQWLPSPTTAAPSGRASGSPRASAPSLQPFEHVPSSASRRHRAMPGPAGLSWRPVQPSLPTSVFDPPTVRRCGKPFRPKQKTGRSTGLRGSVRFGSSQEVRATPDETTFNVGLKDH